MSKYNDNSFNDMKVYFYRVRKKFTFKNLLLDKHVSGKTFKTVNRWGLYYITECKVGNVWEPMSQYDSEHDAYAGLTFLYQRWMIK